MSQNNWVAEISKSLKADPKKTGSLAVLLVLLGVLTAKQFMGHKGEPSSAGAAMVGNKLETAVSTKPGSRGAANSVAALQKWADGPRAPITRNLFAVRMDYFPMDGSRTVQNGPNDEVFWSKLEKSLSLRTDERQRHENLVASFKADAEKLNLQSTMPGATPRAMINGELVGEGDVVAKFRVTSIEARKIIIEREGIMLEIQMK